MNVWLATDLDDTWVKTARKLGKGVFVNVVPENASVEPTFISAKSLAWFDVLRRGGVRLVPVTGRSVESCATWRIHGKPIWNQGGIYAHGADMRSLENQPVEEWDQHVKQIIAANEHALSLWGDATGQAIGILAEGVLRLHPLKKEGQTFGWVVKAKSSEAESMLGHLKSDFGTSATQLGLTWFTQKNHLTVLPSGISKREALSFWKKTFAAEDGVWVGAGDALKDGEFMDTCDWVLSPVDSEWARNKK